MSDGRKLRVDVDDTVPGYVLIRLDGELDVGSAQVFRNAVGPHAGSGDEIVVDISDLRFCDSTGLGALVAVYRGATGAGARLHLCAPQPQLSKTLGVTGLDRVFVVHKDVPTALGSFGDS